MRTFDNLSNRALRAYNRFVTMSNLNADFGKSTAQEYFDQFDEDSQREMRSMSAIVKGLGVERTKEMIMSEVEPEDYDHEYSESEGEGGTAIVEPV